MRENFKIELTSENPYCKGVSTAAIACNPSFTYEKENKTLHG
ncbi:MAG: hypothetical protein ACJA1A_003111 [Saprospiraceae bacterium]|jgi:hypothetical protein